MYKAQIVSNKLVEQRKKQIDDEIHIKTLQNIKHRVDTGQPQSTQLSFLHKKLKEKIFENKYQSIDRENKILLEKITIIMQKPQNSYNQFGKINSQHLNQMTHAQRQLGFHQARRKKELMRIAMDNQKLLQRIQAKKPTYDSDKWEDERVKNEQYMKNICSYEPTKSNYTAQKNNKTYNQANTKSMNYISNYKSYSVSKDNQTRSQQEKADFVTHNQAEKKKVMICRQSKKINDQNYIVQIFIENKNLIVYMDNAKSLDKYLFQIDEKVGLQFINENYQNNVEQLVDDFVYKDGNFHIKNTQYYFEKVSRRQNTNVLGSLSAKTKYNSKKTSKKNTQFTEESENDPDIEPFSKTTAKKSKKQNEIQRKYDIDNDTDQPQDQPNNQQDSQEYKMNDSNDKQ